MIVFVNRLTDAVQIRARAESEDGSIEGDLIELVRPGETCLGYAYEWWAALPDGAIELSDEEDRPVPSADEEPDCRVVIHDDDGNDVYRPSDLFDDRSGAP